MAVEDGGLKRDPAGVSATGMLASSPSRLPVPKIKIWIQCREAQEI